MRSSIFTYCVVALSFLAASHCAPASAGLVLTIQPSVATVNRPTAPLTNNVTFSVLLGTDAGMESVLSYNIPIDLSPPVGTDPPPGITVISVTQRLAFAGSPFESNLNPPEGDLLASAGFQNFSQPIQFTTVPVVLFDFTVAVGSTAQLGDYSASFVRGALFALDPGFTNTVNISSRGTIQVVPEPSCCGLVGLALVSGFGFRTRRR